MFYKLPDAYNRGFLTNDDLRDIAWFYYGEELNLEYHAGLPRYLQNRIRGVYSFYVKQYFPEIDWQDIWQAVQIEKYYGYYNITTYNGDTAWRNGSRDIDCIAVMMVSGSSYYPDTGWEETVADTLFRYNDGNRILIWEHASDYFYELQEAYELGLLTEDDIRSIAYYHETGKTISYN